MKTDIERSHARRSKSSNNSAVRKTDSYLETDLFFLGFQTAVITALCWLSSSVVDLSITAELQLWPVRAKGSRVELSAQTSTVLRHTHTIIRHILISQHLTIYVIDFI